MNVFDQPTYDHLNCGLFRIDLTFLQMVIEILQA